jgi:hypothetical protein
MGYGLGVAIDQIHSISPNARVFIVGYPRLIPPNGAGCWGKTNISSVDAPIFDIWQRSIAEVQKSMAEAHDADYVDMYEASAGHDGCQSSGQWTNPDLNANPNDHPTLAGMQAMAQRLITAINTPKASKGGTGANGQTISLVFTARKVRAASAPLAPVVGNAPSKHGAKFSVTLKNAADVDFFVDRAKPGQGRQVPIDVKQRGRGPQGVHSLRARGEHHEADPPGWRLNRLLHRSLRCKAIEVRQVPRARSDQRPLGQNADFLTLKLVAPEPLPGLPIGEPGCTLRGRLH